MSRARQFGSPLRRAFNSHAATPSSSSTMDRESVSHFGKLSAQWWNPVGEFSLLHAMNPIRLDFMRAKLEEVGEWEETQQLLRAKRDGQRIVPVARPWESTGRWLKDTTVLDVGCGGGLLSESLTRVGAQVTGIDASDENIKIAALHASNDPGFRRSGGPRYENVMAEDLLTQGGKEQYDIVTAMEVIEHVRSPRFFLQTLADLVKPGGHLFMSTIARTPLSHFLTIFMAERVLSLVSPGTHRHDQYINPAELVQHFTSDIPWIQQESSGSTDPLRPRRLQVETRGAFYLPLLGKWILASRGTAGYGSEMSNYFFWVRKPL